MSLREEIKPFIDGFGLISPNLPVPGKRGSDNGLMFSAEYYIMLSHQPDYNPVADANDFHDLTEDCVENNILNRAPGDKDIEGPDDYYAVFAACVQLDIPELGQQLLDGINSHKGFLNNETGENTAQSFLIRQPQLLAAAYAAADRAPIWSWPLYGYAAAVIAGACRNIDPSDSDSWRLTWHLIKAVSSKSLACRIAAKGWYSRLYKAFPDGMKGVAKLYYKDNHPFTQYFAD